MLKETATISKKNLGSRGRDESGLLAPGCHHDQPIFLSAFIWKIRQGRRSISTFFSSALFICRTNLLFMQFSLRPKRFCFFVFFFYSFNPGLYHTLQIHGKARSLPRPSPTLFFSVFLSVLIYLVLKNMEFFTNVSVGLNGILFFFF